MIDQDTLNEALEKGVITLEQVAAIQALADQRQTKTHVYPAADEENFRLITSFNDIFVTLGLALFFGALTYLLRNGIGSYLAPFQNGIVMIAAWFLAWYFTLKRRMALPSITLLLIFGGFTFWLLIDVFTVGVGLGEAEFSKKFDRETFTMLIILMSSLMTAGAVYLHWRTFRVPITVAAGICALIGAALSLIYLIVGPDKFEVALKPLVFLAGLATFALAMRFDSKDTRRQTRLTDMAFWLHLLAAPLIVHPLLSDMITEKADLALVSAFMLLVLFALLGLMALVVDRRAILVSSLIYAGYAFAAVIKTSGLGKDVLIPTTILLLGVFILILSAGWTPLRRKIVRKLPNQWKHYVPQSA